ncbi:ADP-ribosylation factor GTPase-activating protein gcs1 [Elasticomyces elasticus]|nr:ADP-ribosylation factor GTPase-activating protein gcs1 [Elasticomyces elasticus]KAK3662572.1 ADP-ribosylation factor GTPase-activating protein gcs1 [Elasticomyces elasticus]KAK4927916.1 ADP-ribosylation factor GTPase-activating protein gcs1 [Elasticomyces elasticus]KAK5756057.1 ADP-ribosylation factor GTPase-activating protein gcs1 [Elasticomyces elasticus]
MWEVDPETRSKLLEIQKRNENNKCVDCGAPSPQWISPKFSIFFCLSCSGIHRGLGVHISFVRSATMDALKISEIARMSAGGNKPWRDFFSSHPSNTIIDRKFEDCTISERYDSEAGEEWKDRLTAKVEGTEYVPGIAKPVVSRAKQASVEDAPASGRNTPLDRVAAVPQRTASPGQQGRNEAFFARMGNENAGRPEGVAPAQGGKYAGFGSAPSSSSNSNSTGSVPSADEFQKDPVAALTKGFGWLSGSVSKQAATIQKSYIAPGVSSLQSGELAASAQRLASQGLSTVQQGTKGLGEQFSKFVDPDAPAAGRSRTAGAGRGGPAPEKPEFWDSFGADPAGPPREKKDFWDDFAGAAETAAAAKQKPAGSSIGTSAMKTGGAGGSGAPAKGKSEGDAGWKDW